LGDLKLEAVLGQPQIKGQRANSAFVIALREQHVQSGIRKTNSEFLLKQEGQLAVTPHVINARDT